MPGSRIRTLVLSENRFGCGADAMVPVLAGLDVLVLVGADVPAATAEALRAAAFDAGRCAESQVSASR